MIEVIPDLLQYRTEQITGSGTVTEWTEHARFSMTTESFNDTVAWFTSDFLNRGLKKGSHVVIFSRHTSIQILAAEFALLDVGVIVCPVHGFMSTEDLQRAITLLQPVLCIVPDDPHRRDLVQVLEAAGIVSDILIPQTSGAAPGSEAEKAAVSPDDPALIILTSGTTGDIKGVVLTHGNITSGILAIMASVPITGKHVHLSFLPISHIFERIVFYTVFAMGAKLHFVRSWLEALRLMHRIHPHYLTAVPKSLEKLFDQFKEVSEDKGFFPRQILAFSLKYATGKSVIRRWLARQFVLFRLRRLFGFRLKGVVVGGAAMSPKLTGWYEAAGVTIREGYGLTECGGVATLNRFTPGENRRGTTGLAMPGIVIEIDSAKPDIPGEILLQGPTVMKGYLDNPEATNRAIDGQGRLHTGDIGFLDSSGFLTITGRRKEIFKNSFGEYVIPSRLEGILKEHNEISEAMVLGPGKSFTSALIRPDFTFLERWCAEHGVHWTSPMYMVHNPEVHKLYSNLLESVNAGLPAHQRIMGFALVAEEWSPESGLVTATLKVRRHAVMDFYEKEINSIYS